jgi:hypothetical protein
MSSEVAAGIIGGFVGGMLGVLGTVVSSYVGPRRLEEWRQRRTDQPRMGLLMSLLEDRSYPDGRYLKTLCMYTGMTDDDCRRLLIEIGAHGAHLKNGEGWVLTKYKPLNMP